ncbi:pectinesterase 3 [Amborella trichopoda]|uniref:pectinesterase 3 n=1 Tax=Amborella trichopoda TaxID=13333 RepID=UPI0005D2FBDC|nr:pectinesterase 3 [Amborella trichopoda]|eukprot:XP_011628481.1 pectinesterase 3 [Amborella trichopoda]
MNSFKGAVNSFKGGINSFKGYGKVNEDLEAKRQYQRKTRKRIAIIALSSVVLIVIIVAAIIGVSRKQGQNGQNARAENLPATAKSIKAVCSVTKNPTSCFSSLSQAADPNQIDPEDIFKLSLKVSMNELEKASTIPAKLGEKVNDKRALAAIKDCSELIADAIDQLNNSLSAMVDDSGHLKLAGKVEDLRTWLSAAITDQETCFDGFENVSGPYLHQLQASLKNATEFTSNSLAIAGKIMDIVSSLGFQLHRRRLLGFSGNSPVNNRRLLDFSGEFPSENSFSGDLAANNKVPGDFPEWISAKDRRFLQGTDPRSSADAVVAQDGSGKFTTIQSAIDSVPKKNEGRFVIYVKKGRYLENVVVDKSKWNIMLIGDGKDVTVVSGSRNFVDGTPTFSTATFAAVGRGFIAQDMGFENTAGPQKHQAVAIRVGSDRSAFLRCKFIGFQDTLYAHSQRQFYRECFISGTVDFIFGNSAVVFQNCEIQSRQPLDNQKNTITAQGKTDPEQNSGISIQGCQLTAETSLTAPTFLGRPWKPYSTTVVMKSVIGAFLNPAGWLPWVGDSAPETIFYGEYLNTGAGSNVTGRVNWVGYQKALSPNDASRFTVGSFLQGAEWLSTTQVAFNAGL